MLQYYGEVVISQVYILRQLFFHFFMKTHIVAYMGKVGPVGPNFFHKVQRFFQIKM